MINTNMWSLQNTMIKEVPLKVFKPKKAGTKTAHTIFILDESSSMISCWDSTIQGFNEFLEGQKEAEIATRVSLYKFNGHSVTNVIDRVSAKEVEPLTNKSYKPSGSTNLLDAIGEVMLTVNTQLAASKKAERDSINIVILTDGEENTSKTFNNTRIKAMVELAEGKEWSFMFLGANIDAFSVGGSLGFSAHNTMQYDTNNIQTTFSSATRMARDMSTAKAQGMDNSMAYAATTFTDEERKNSI